MFHLCRPRGTLLAFSPLQIWKVETFLRATIIEGCSVSEGVRAFKRTRWDLQMSGSTDAT